jgi:hypothetical protein
MAQNAWYLSYLPSMDSSGRRRGLILRLRLGRGEPCGLFLILEDASLSRRRVGRLLGGCRHLGCLAADAGLSVVVGAAIAVVDVA